MASKTLASSRCGVIVYAEKRYCRQARIPSPKIEKPRKITPFLLTSGAPSFGSISKWPQFLSMPAALLSLLLFRDRRGTQRAALMCRGHGSVVVIYTTRLSSFVCLFSVSLRHFARLLLFFSTRARRKWVALYSHLVAGDGAFTGVDSRGYILRNGLRNTYLKPEKLLERQSWEALLKRRALERTLLS